MEKKDPTFLDKEKAKKQAIQQAKYEKEMIIEQNKLMKAQNERNKIVVEEQELSARSWKAFHDKMFYSMECERIEPQYKEYQQRATDRMEAQKEEYKKMQEKLQEELNKNKEDGEIKLEPVPEAVDKLEVDSTFPIEEEKEVLHENSVEIESELPKRE